LQALLAAAMWWTDRNMTQVDLPLLPGSLQKLQENGMTCEPHEDLFFVTWDCACKHLRKCSFWYLETQSSTLILEVTQVITWEIALVLVNQIWYLGLLEFAHVTVAAVIYFYLTCHNKMESDKQTTSSILRYGC
jgi:hypothetical protein